MLVILSHSDSVDVVDLQQNKINLVVSHQANYILRVEGLDSGYTNGITGQVSCASIVIFAWLHNYWWN